MRVDEVDRLFSLTIRLYSIPRYTYDTSIEYGRNSVSANIIENRDNRAFETTTIMSETMMTTI